MADTMTVIGRFKLDSTGFKTLGNLTNYAEKGINKLERRTKFLGKTSQRTSRKLNKMMDSYRKRTEKSTVATSGLVSKMGALALGFVSLRQAFSAFDLASDMTEIQNKLNVVFGKMAKDADKWAEEYADTLGFSVMKTKESMGDIQNLFTGFGMGRKTSFEMTKQIVTLANDLDSFNNLSSRGIDVQRTMISALMGETEAAKTLGASILESNLQVAAADLGLGKYSSKMKEATKIKIRFHAIEMQSKDAIGDVARNLDTEVAKRRMLRKEIEKQKIALGNELMPLWEDGLVITTELVSKLGALGSTFKNIYKWSEKNSLSALALKTSVVALAGAYTTYKTVSLAVLTVTKARDAWKATKSIPLNFKENLSILKNTAVLGGQKIALLAGVVATKAMTAAQWALNVALDANPIGLVIAGVTALGAGLYFAYKKSEPFRNFLDSIIEKGKKIFKLMTKLPGFKITKKILGFGEESQIQEKLASGTRSTKGGMTLVGEKGPELVNMPQGAEVFNNADTRNIYNSANKSNKSIVVQGDTITLNIKVNAQDVDDMTQKIKEVLNEHANRKKSRLIAMYKGV